MSKTDKRLFLLDAFALIYRAYYGLGDNFLFNSKGFNTTAVSLFTDSLYRLMQKEKPTHIAIAFDMFGPTTRDEVVDFYKANRQEMPEDIKLSLPIIRDILDGFKIPILELAGYEADDIVGTIAKDAAQKGYTVYMVTPDKDYGQLVEENIYMYKPPFRGKPEEIFGVDEIKKKWDVERIDQVIDMLGLMGDKVDNIPGIPGVGEKTAQKLLKQFSTIENLIDNTDQLKGKLQEKVIEHAEMAKISKLLATIILDVPIEYNIDDFILEEPDKKVLGKIFAEMELRTIGKRIIGDNYNVNLAVKNAQPTLFDNDNVDGQEGIAAEPEEQKGKTINDVEHEYILCDTDEKIDKLIKHLEKAKQFCFDTETTGIDANEAELVGISFSTKPHKAYYVPCPLDKIEATNIVLKFKHIFEDKKIAKVAQNIKYDILMLKWYGVETKGEIEDTMLAHYLLEPEMRHKMDFLSETYLNYTPVGIEELIGKKGKNQGNMRDVELETVKEYAAEDADITLQLHQYFKPLIKKEKLKKLYNDVELPLIKVLVEMEYNGVRLDSKFLEKYSKELGEELFDIRQSVFDTAGSEFNLDSPKQLGTVLFDNLGIEYKGKKTKTGQYSTNEDTLSKLADDNPIVNEIMTYRMLTKLKSTYVDALPNIVNSKTGRIHSSFNQAVAATGRLSSNNPNLQNIPIRTDKGRKVREAFIPRDENFVLLSADYSQVELRIIAALSNDKAMIKAFKDGIDIHTATAAKVYGVILEDVDSEMRRKAKMVNFGIIYGISAYGLGQRLKIKRGEAKELIDGYFAEYPNIAKYMENQKEYARKKGYVETILGRKRTLKDINSRNATVRGFAERNAINSPIQGSAADLIKVAMINIHEKMKKKDYRSKMILQVHDELVFDVHKDEVEDIQKLVNKEMSTAIKLDVPLVVESGIGQNWLEAH